MEIDAGKEFQKKEGGGEKKEEKKEKIIAEYTCHHNRTKWKATEKGVVKINDGLSAHSESLLPYSHISSITLKKKNKHWLLLLGGVAGLAGILVNLIPSLFPMPFLSVFSNTFLYFIGLALLLIILGFSLNSTYYEFTGEGLAKDEWHIELLGKESQEEMEKFVQEVEKRL